MTSLANIRENIDANQAMGGLVEVYEEMASKVMKEIREAILSSRDYYHGLAKLSSEVGADLASLNLEKQNKKSALVLLASDEGMYGEIVEAVIGRFMQAVKEQGAGSDVYVAGVMGGEIVRALAPRLQFTPLPLPKLAQLEKSLPLITQQLAKYVRVEIFFGQFDNIVRQSPMSRVLSAGEIELTRDKWAGQVEMKLKYLYEPTIEKIAGVFGREIFDGVIEQTIKEGELAKNASRLMHLDQAWGEIERTLSKDRQIYGKMKKRLRSKKQHLQLSTYLARSGK